MSLNWLLDVVLFQWWDFGDGTIWALRMFIFITPVWSLYLVQSSSKTWATLLLTANGSFKNSKCLCEVNFILHVNPCWIFEKLNVFKIHGHEDVVLIACNVFEVWHSALNGSFCYLTLYIRIRNYSFCLLQGWKFSWLLFRQGAIDT